MQAGVDADWLDLVATPPRRTRSAGAIRWLDYTIETELLMNEITDSTTRISTLVGAAKQYSQMDRSPDQTVDVHELLDSTLVMLARKIPPGVRVVKEYDASLPPSRRTPPSSTRCGPTSSTTPSRPWARPAR